MKQISISTTDNKKEQSCLIQLVCCKFPPIMRNGNVFKLGIKMLTLHGKNFTVITVHGVSLFFIPFQTNLFQCMKMNMILHASLGGAYISYIYPRRLYVYYMNLILDGCLLKIMDFFAHHTFLLYYLMCVENRPLSLLSCDGSFIDLMLVNTPFIIYFCNFNIGYRYGLRMSDLAIIGMVYMIIVGLGCFI